MYAYSDIQHLHLEITSRCNAACPLCPRNFHGYEYNDGYVEHDMSLNEFKQIFPVDFIRQLKKIHVNGNFGDMVMNPETIDIITYIRSITTDCDVVIDTNGGARDAKFWQSLAQLNVVVRFSFDGLEDTNHLYRQNVVWTTAIRNAERYIQAGGRAHWKFIPFDHNRHQFNEIKKIAAEMGFEQTYTSDWGRNVGPVYNRSGELTHTLGKPAETNFKILFDRRRTSEVLLEDIIQDKIPTPIECYVKKIKSVYVSSTGHVYPCCKVGFSPDTYGRGNHFEPENKQIAKMIKKNNALEYSLEECIKWFKEIEKTWSIPTFEQGRTVICNDVCGQKNR